MQIFHFSLPKRRSKEKRSKKQKSEIVGNAQTNQKNLIEIDSKPKFNNKYELIGKNPIEIKFTVPIIW